MLLYIVKYVSLEYIVSALSVVGSSNMGNRSGELSSDGLLAQVFLVIYTHTLV